jgi:hypothetical protein
MLKEIMDDLANLKPVTQAMYLLYYATGSGGGYWAKYSAHFKNEGPGYRAVKAAERGEQDLEAIREFEEILGEVRGRVPYGLWDKEVESLVGYGGELADWCDLDRGLQEFAGPLLRRLRSGNFAPARVRVCRSSEVMSCRDLLERTTNVSNSGPF